MTDPVGPDPGQAPPTAEPRPTAGAMIRRAREARGLHIAAFAAALKIPQRKVEALEADRYADLPDAAFTRALAKSACRSLKIDPAPVLALLPQLDVGVLDQVGAGLNTPFREGRGPLFEGMNWIRSPALWIVLVLAIGAALILLWPRPRMSTPVSATPAIEAPAAVAEMASDAAFAPAPLVEVAASAAAPAAPLVGPGPGPAVEPAPTESVAAAAPAADKPKLVMVTVTADSWVEIVDGNQRGLLSRVVRQGEQIGLDGALPMRVTVGNVGATTLRLRGVEVNLAAAARGNVARVELR